MIVEGVVPLQFVLRYEIAEPVILARDDLELDAVLFYDFSFRECGLFRGETQSSRESIMICVFGCGRDVPFLIEKGAGKLGYRICSQKIGKFFAIVVTEVCFGNVVA